MLKQPAIWLGLSAEALAVALAFGLMLAYFALALVLHPAELEGDEQRYYQDVINLTHGYFVADEFPRIFNGTGYPFFLYPFVKLGLPVIWMRLSGAVMIGAAAWFLFLAGRLVMSKPWALAMAAWCSLHPNLLKQGHTLMTEPMCHLFLSIFLWSFIHALRSHRKWLAWGILAALSIGWLTMVRVFTGHVITAMIFGSAAICWFPAYREAAKRSLTVMVAALLLCVPYLSYTHAKTGHYYFWSTSAGELFYWLSSHQNGENGVWYHEDEVMRRPVLAVGHADFYRQIRNLGPLERDAAFKKAAFERVASDPMAFAKNWICNVCRLFFGFPRSLEIERLSCFPIIAVNGTLLLGLMAGLWLSWVRREPLEPPLVLLLLMAGFYTGGSTLAPALPRYFVGIVPVIALITASLLARVPWGNLLRNDRFARDRAA